MKAENKFPSSRQTNTPARSACDILDDLREEKPMSLFVEELLEKEKRRRERETFYRKAVAAYTPEVQVETLEFNESTPLASE